MLNNIQCTNESYGRGRNTLIVYYIMGKGTAQAGGVTRLHSSNGEQTFCFPKHQNVL